VGLRLHNDVAITRTSHVGGVEDSVLLGFEEREADRVQGLSVGLTILATREPTNGVGIIGLENGRRVLPLDPEVSVTEGILRSDSRKRIVVLLLLDPVRDRVRRVGTETEDDVDGRLTNGDRRTEPGRARVQVVRGTIVDPVERGTTRNVRDIVPVVVPEVAGVNGVQTEVALLRGLLIEGATEFGLGDLSHDFDFVIVLLKLLSENFRVFRSSVLKGPIERHLKEVILVLREGVLLCADIRRRVCLRHFSLPLRRPARWALPWPAGTSTHHCRPSYHCRESTTACGYELRPSVPAPKSRH